ncbi:hypothetical protein C5S32_08485 [ANME-1 cluster archaeon GoMg1]|nr:hypothetical protein [ANME-1 cluster archaeon GoMg1]
MVRISEELKEIIWDNTSYFATASRDGKPNVVQVGLVKVICDDELLIADFFFRKTRGNLEKNPQVSLGVMDMRKLKAYQLKGEAKIITQGELFNEASEILMEKAEIGKKTFQELSELAKGDPKLARRIQHVKDIHKNKKIKAAILIKIKEIYSTMPGEKYEQ